MGVLRAVALSRHAAGKGRRGRAVCQNITEEWDVSIDIASVRKSVCEEAGTKGARGCKRDEGRPPRRWLRSYILGSPVGHTDFVSAWARRRLAGP